MQDYPDILTVSRLIKRRLIATVAIMTTEASTSSYHHGDLRKTLLEVTTDMIRESGIEGLSLRKLADRVGVSRTAPYHHFKDKNELLCAIAEEGFRQHHLQGQLNFTDESRSMHERFRSFVHNYVKFASENPELYELMFGRTIWKQQGSTEELRSAAYPCFQHQLAMTKAWQEMGLLNRDENTLRLSQVIWGTLHGIAKLMIDGIYTNTDQIEEICECAVKVFIHHSFSNGLTN